MPTRVLIPSGVLGLGFDSKALAKGVAMKPDIICIDGGSTDSGPFYLGTGTSKYSRAATKTEWRELMEARAHLNVPLVIGSCGTCGTKQTVDWMFEITKELAEELGQSLKIAKLYSDQSSTLLKTALNDNKIKPLQPAPDISCELIDTFENTVALAGAEQIAAAINSGADIILAGRTTDTATISALPIMRGDSDGAAWHGAKVGECGALCSTNPTSGVIVVDFDDKGFTIEPLADGAMCTPHSVSAHMLYENSDPFILYEPGGYLDVTQATYSALDERRVRVEGSIWNAQKPYTIKLEAAKVVGYQTTIIAILRDAHYVANAQKWTQQLQEFLVKEISRRMDLPPEDYTLEFRLIGVDATLGKLESKTSVPAEVGVLGIITANDQETASEIGQLINPFVLHYPLTENEELPTFAFPFSPAQTDRGELYEFALNHIMEIDDPDPMAAFTLELEEIDYA